MSLLDEARRLAGGNPFGDFNDDAAWKCPFCGMPSGRHSGFGDMHRDDCPWLALPRIVAALEVAERLATRFGDRFPTEIEDTSDGESFAIAYACCGGNFYSPHMKYCPWQALVAALRGEGVTA